MVRRCRYLRKGWRQSDTGERHWGNEVRRKKPTPKDRGDSTQLNKHKYRLKWWNCTVNAAFLTVLYSSEVV